MNANVNPKTIFTGDNLPIMRGMNSESVDLIYLDPPFNSKANYAAPIGSEAAGAEFKDTWTLNDVDAAMSDSDKSYLIYMAVRLLEMHRVLKPTGSIYLHCDPTMSHYLKLVMDAVFGKGNFRNEIAWGKYIGRKNNARKKFGTQQDIILYYANPSAIFSPQYEPLSESARKEYRHKDKNGRLYRYARRGKGYESAGGNRRIYLDENKGNAIGTLWVSKDLQLGQSSKERTGYPTQKPLALLDRIIKASSNEGDLVFDPFCGCATTLVAADRDQRNWIGIDISAKAAELVVERIRDDQGLFEDIVARTDIPKRTDLGNIPRYNAPENRTRLYGEQGGNCNGCGTHFESQHLEIDHIIARSVGGTDHIENLQLLCGHCNRIKGNRGQEYLISRLNKD